MRILLMESRPGLAVDAEAELTANGHELVRCHEPGSPTFPCLELESPGSCPLEGGPTVDCVVAVHGPDAVPTAAEAGVTCALRRGVPVVSQHEGPEGPFTGWAIPSELGNITAACETAVTAAHAHEVRPLVTEVERLLLAADGAETDVSVRIRREADRTRISVTVPPDSPVSAGHIATRVHARYRATTRKTDSVVDVEVHPR